MVQHGMRAVAEVEAAGIITMQEVAIIAVEEEDIMARGIAKLNK